MVRAGEASGALAVIFERLAEFERSRDELRNYIISSMIYPALLAWVGLTSIFILLNFVATTTIPPTTVAPEIIFWANINNIYNSYGHAGTELDPFSWNDLNNHSYLNPLGNTYNILGFYSDDNTCGTFLNTSSNTWQSWNPGVNGMWGVSSLDVESCSGINVGDNGEIYCHASLVKDGIFYTPISNYSGITALGSFINCRFVSDGLYGIHGFIYAWFYGCSIYGTLYGDADGLKINLFDSCIKLLATTGTQTLSRCAIAGSIRIGNDDKAPGPLHGPRLRTEEDAA